MVLSEYPSHKLKERIGPGLRERNRFLFCARFLQHVAGKEQQCRGVWNPNQAVNGTRYYEFAVYILLHYLMFIN